MKEERTKNLRLLVEKLSEKNIEATIPPISKKMLSLKNHFSSEKKKVEASSKKSGSRVSDVYNPKWQFYRHLIFLKDNFTPRLTETNLKRSFSSRNTKEVQSLPIKRDTRIEAMSRVADSMADMAQTIRQKRCCASNHRKGKNREIRGRDLWENDNKNDCWYIRVRGKVLTKTANSTRYCQN